jgi:S1-C subfamily serine protease
MNTHSPEHPDPSRVRLHPLAVTAFVLSLIGIPLLGLITGPIAAITAAIALSRISGDLRFRGKGLAVAAVAIGFADTVLWMLLIGLVVPVVNLPTSRAMDKHTVPSPNLMERAPLPIRHALESNVFLVGTRDRWPSFLDAESYSGSGVILGYTDKGCLILTNRHVADPSFSPNVSLPVRRSGTITAYFWDGSCDKARLWWTAPDGADLAVLATGTDAESVPLFDAAPPKPPVVGEKVFAVGNPHDLGWSYTEGAVSGIREMGKGPVRLRLYQTQAPINEGNSGGGLYTTDGTLVGIVAWTKDKSRAEGISFAIAYEDFLRMYKKRSRPPSHEGGRDRVSEN